MNQCNLLRLICELEKREVLRLLRVVGCRASGNRSISSEYIAVLYGLRVLRALIPLRIKSAQPSLQWQITSEVAGGSAEGSRP